MNANSSSQLPQPSAARALSIDIPESHDGNSQHIELELDGGHLYHVVTARSAIRNAIVERLVDAEGAAVVRADGGLIGNLKAWENLVLPATYHTNARVLDLEANARHLFAEFGVSGADFERLCSRLPEELNRFERRLCAFVRAMLTEPQFVVYDSLFNGLTREETVKVVSFDRRFHERFTRGTSLHLTADLPTLPDLGARRTFHL